MGKTYEVAFKLGGELTSSFKNAFSDAEGTMKSLGVAATAIGSVVGISELASQLIEADDAMAKLSAQTGTYGAEMEALSDISENLFKGNYGESFEDINLALANVKQNIKGLDNGELEKMTGDALIYADTFDSDVNEVTRAANNMMTNFGIESSKAMDLFAKGAQNGLDFSGEMLDNVAEYSPLFAQMGYSAEEYFGILERGSAAGVYNLDYVNDVMKEFQIRTKDGSKTTSDAMDLMSSSTQKVWTEFLKGNGTVSDVASTVVSELKGMDNQVMASQIGVSLFGTKWEDLETDAIYAMLGTTDAMSDFEGTMQKVNETRFDTFGSAIQGIGRIMFMDLVYPIGESLLPILSDTANYLNNNLSGAIETAKNTIVELMPVITGAATAFVAFQTVSFATMAIGKLQFAMKLLLNPMTRASTLVRIWTKVQAILNATLLANPIGLVIAVLAGLTVGLITAYKMSDTFRAKVDAAFLAVKDTVTSTIEYIETTSVDMWNGLVDSVNGIGDKIASALNIELSSKVSEIVSGFVESFKAGLSSLPGIISMIAPIATKIGLSFLGISGPAGLVIGLIVSVGGWLYRLSQTNDGVAQAFSNAWESVKTTFAPIVQVFKDGFQQLATEIGPQLSETMNVISESIIALGPSFSELGSTLVQLGLLIFSTWSSTIGQLSTTVLPMLLQGFQMIFPMILTLLQMVVPIIVQLFISIIPVIIQIAQLVIPMILQAIQLVFPIVLTIIQTVLPIFASLLMAVASIILQLAQVIIPLILTVIQAVFPIILSIIQAIIPVITVILQGLVMIINSVLIPAINGIMAVVQFVFPFIQMIIQNALAIINGIIQAAMALLQGDWGGAWDAILGIATDIMHNIIDFFTSIDLFEVGSKIINGLINGIKSMAGAVVGAIAGLIPEPIRGAVTKVVGAIPGFAIGGVVSSPTMAMIGEGGDTESIIPWNNSKRSLDLWTQTGHAIGAFNAGSERVQTAQTVGTFSANKPSPLAVNSSSVKSNNQQTITIQLSPTIVIQGDNVDRSEIQSQFDKSNESMIDQLKDYFKNEGRLAFE